MKKYLIIVAGWHYIRNNFYETLIEILNENENTDLFISSHKKNDEVDKYFLDLFNASKRIIFKEFENIGYDWGMYSQCIDFLGEKINKYDYICFLHDDIEIKQKNFLSVFSDYIESNNLIMLGNCKNASLFPFQKTHPHVIEWLRLSKWKFEIKIEKWSSIRGSCFMVKRELFNKFPGIPYKNGSHPGYGNWGVISFSGIISSLFGTEAVKTISDEDLDSDYICEYHRGENKKKLSGNKEILFNYEKTVKEAELKINIGCGLKYMEGYLNIDISEKSNADVIGNIMEIFFKPDSVSEFLMYHFIEHLDRFNAEKLMAKLYSELKKDGRLIIECPDLLKVSKLIIKNRKKLDELENGAYGFRGFFGEPFENMPVFDYHKWGYTEFTLSEKLKKIGFDKIKIEKPLSHGQRSNRDLRIVAIK